MQAEKVTSMPYKIDLNTLRTALISRYTIDDHFFEAVGNSIVKNGDLKATIEITPKREKEFNVHFDIRGTITVPCDLCLDDMKLPVDIKKDILVKLGHDVGETDTHLVVNESEGQLDAAPIIYDFIVLSIPIRRVHADGECNTMMSEQLKNYLVN